MNTLVFNFFLYLIYTTISIYKCRAFTVHNMLAVWFTFIAFMGCVSVEYGYYGIIYGRIPDVLPIAPYLLCFLCFILLELPLRKINCKHLELSDIPSIENIKFRKVAIFVSFILLLFTIVYIPPTIVTLSMKNVADSYEMQHVDGESIYKFSPVASAIIWVGRKVYNWFYALLLFYGIYNLVIKKSRRTKYLAFIIIVSILPYFLRTISIGGRGGFIFFSFALFLTVSPFVSYMNKKARRKALMIILASALLVIPYIAAMSSGRVEGASETAVGSIIRYFGEPFPNLGYVLWDKVNFLMGRRMFPELFGYNYDEMSQYDLFRHLAFYAKVPVLNYKTIFGDFYLEFGTTITICIFICVSYFMCRYLDKGKLSFYSIPLYAYYLDICATAPLWFSRRNTGDLFIIVQCLIVSYLLKRYLAK